MDTDERKWVNVFLEVTLRAIRRVHYEYGIWGAGRQWKMGRDRTPLINMGYGIELADERAVCAAITQEFMTSPAVTGLWHEEGAEDELRFFGITREEKYESSDQKSRPERVDLVLEKYEPGSEGKLEVQEPRSFIEAKRARLWQVNLATGDVQPGPQQMTEICEDIVKLKREQAARLDKKNEKIYIHLLVWGIYEESPNGEQATFADHPHEFFEKIKNTSKTSLEAPYARWLPMRWETPSGGNPAKRCPSVSRAAWIGLAEIGEGGGDAV
jgi:hypothetical protein